MNRIVLAALACALCLAAPAVADFPFHGTVSDEIHCDSWKMAATPEPDSGCGANGNPVLMAQNAAVRADPQELGGVRGDATADIDPAAKTAWQITTGRPDVTIAVLDSGIKWNDAGRHERPAPQGPPQHRRAAAARGLHERTTATATASSTCDDYARRPARHDRNGPRRVGPPGCLTPQDLIIAFSDGTDHDHNGYVDDIAGWDFVDNDNDPFDDVQYGHGTGEAEDSTAEAEQRRRRRHVPELHGAAAARRRSFVADVNRFAAGDALRDRQRRRA